MRTVNCSFNMQKLFWGWTGKNRSMNLLRKMNNLCVTIFRQFWNVLSIKIFTAVQNISVSQITETGIKSYLFIFVF